MSREKTTYIVKVREYDLGAMWEVDLTLISAESDEEAMALARRMVKPRSNLGCRLEGVGKVEWLDEG